MRDMNFMLFFIAPDAQHQRSGQGIDNRDANAVQTARNLIGILVKFAACMKLRHDDLCGRHTLFVHTGGNATTIVSDRDRAIGIQRDCDNIRMAGQGFVNGIVHHLINHMVQARTVVRVADIHARAFAHRIQPFEHLDRIRAIRIGIRVG